MLGEFDAGSWAALCRGDEGVRAGAWEAIERHCRRYLRLRGIPLEELSDALHAVFEDVCRYACAHLETPPACFAGFLKGRARGVFSVWAKDRTRRREEQAVEDAIEPQQREADPAHAVEEADSRRAQQRAIEACRDRLEAELYRPVWCLRYEAGLDLKGVAEHLGRAANTVAVQVHRANLMMRECLTAKGMEP